MVRHQKTIISSLRDPDTSIRRKALELLFTMCTESSAREIVGELLGHLSLADFSMREELVLKTAVLAERFVSDLAWYVDVMLTLMERAGEFGTDDLWQSLAQLVTNHPDTQAHAATKALEGLRHGAAPDVFVKCAAWLVGEYGRLATTVPPTEQFQLLHACFAGASSQAKVGCTSASRISTVCD